MNKKRRWSIWALKEIFRPLHIGYIYIYVLNPWLYGSLTAVVSLITDVHTSMSPSYSLHLLTFITRTSFSTSSSHLSLDIPLLLPPTGLLASTFITVLPWPILTTCPIHSNLFFLISSTVTRSFHSYLNSWLVPILLTPCSTTGPYRVIHKSLRDFRTRLRNNQDRHGKKEHINR